MPRLPADSGLARASSAVLETSRNGNDSFDTGGGASDASTSKLLQSLPGQLSWAVYQLSGVGGADELLQLDVEVSSPSFGGMAPGYWVGISDYGSGYWRFVTRAQASYRRLLAGHEPYRSPAGNIYVVVAIYDAQSIAVDHVRLKYDDQPETGWNVLTLASGNSGWSPAITVDTYGSPWVAYVDRNAGQAKYKWGNALVDLTQFTNWLPTEETSGYIVADQGGTPDATAKTDWVDLTMNTGQTQLGEPIDLPVASLMYLDEPGASTNSVGGVSAFQIGAQSQRFWLNYAFNTALDTPSYSSIDYNGAQNLFGMVSSPLNGSPPSALHFWSIDLSDLLNPHIALTTIDPGVQLFFPHYRADLGGVDRIVARGAALYEKPDAPTAWTKAFEETGTGKLGSLAANISGIGMAEYGISFSKALGNQQTLFYTWFDSSGNDTAEEVASIPVTIGTGDWIGAASQLAYMRDGSPVIVYTQRAAGNVSINFARRDGAGTWTTEPVSDVPSQEGADPEDVLVDVGVEPVDMFDGFTPTGRIWIVWNSIQGSGCSFKLAQFVP